MNKENTKYQFLIGSILLVAILSCNDDDREVAMEVKGPFYGTDIIQQFGLDSVPFNIHSKDIYVAKLINNSESFVSIESSSENQIFPDSSWYHSYMPYSADRRSWNTMKMDKPKNGIYKSKLQPNESQLFWFSNYYDDYIDSMSIYFTVFYGNIKNELIVTELYVNKRKPKTKYELIDSKAPIEFAYQREIEIDVEGPFTYKKTNVILNVDIPFSNDSEEVFIFDIKNNGEEYLYVERWAYDEINIDTIYSFSPFTQTSTEYLWIQNTSKKVAKPIDTIVLGPQDSHKFWDSYGNILPTMDSIAFIETFRTDNYLIDRIELFEVRKN